VKLADRRLIGKDGIVMNDTISRAAAIDALDKVAEMFPYRIPGNAKTYRQYNEAWSDAIDAAENALEALPSAQPPKEIPKRVLWSGWKGCRDTRYKCPNCEKPVRNDDTYCHRCGQRLMFPKISFTDYVPGEKQDVIVRWDDE